MQSIYIGKERKTERFHKHWQFCVGSGHAKMAMRSDYAKQLKRVHDELGIQRVRFHGIFCDDMHTMAGFDEVLPFPGAEKIVERSFYHCGVVYDNILATGMKPFVELSFMPDALAREKNFGKSKGFYGANFSTPENMDAWAEHVGEFVKYLIHRYGKEEVETWYFEVWNEPDLCGSFFKGTQEDYFTLYKKTAETIKSIYEKLMVGGPSTSGSRWVDSFVAFCQQNKVPLDFISTHQYAGDPLTGVTEPGAEGTEEDLGQKMQLLYQMLSNLPENVTHLQIMRMMMGDPSEDPAFPEGRFRDNSATVRAQAGSYPVYYTEWNFQAIFGVRHNDTRKAAAYLVKTALEIEPNVNGSSVWTFSDIFEELHQFSEEFHGGFGLQTIHGIPKPSFHALKLLSMLPEERIALSEDTISGDIDAAAFEDQDTLYVLLFRQKMQQADVPAEPVRVSIDMQAASSEAKLYRIDETHCNPLALYEEMGCPKDLTPGQVRQIEAVSALREEALPLAVQDGNTIFEVSLGVNDIYLVRIGKAQ